MSGAPRKSRAATSKAKTEKAAFARRSVLLDKYSVRDNFGMVTVHIKHYRRLYQAYHWALPKEPRPEPTGPPWTKHQYRDMVQDLIEDDPSCKEADAAKLPRTPTVPVPAPVPVTVPLPDKFLHLGQDGLQLARNQLDDAKRLVDDAVNELSELHELIKADRPDLAKRFEVAVFIRNDLTPKEKANVVAGIAEELERGQPFPNAKKHGKNKRKPGRRRSRTPKARQYVKLDQIAAMVRRSKRTMQKLRKRKLNPLPAPAIQGDRGKASELIWGDIRSWLEEEFSKSLPPKFPSRLDLMRN
jgi:hypothetical protein